jgi:hypothetical protein
MYFYKFLTVEMSKHVDLRASPGVTDVHLPMVAPAPVAVIEGEGSVGTLPGPSDLGDR